MTPPSKVVLNHTAQAVIGSGFTLCGMPPKVPLARRRYEDCTTCGKRRLVIEIHSGNIYIGPTMTCMGCGADMYGEGWLSPADALEEARAALPHAVPTAVYDERVHQLEIWQLGLDDGDETA